MKRWRDVKEEGTEIRNGWMDGRKEGRMEGWMEGWMDRGREIEMEMEMSWSAASLRGAGGSLNTRSCLSPCSCAKSQFTPRELTNNRNNPHLEATTPPQC